MTHILVYGSNLAGRHGKGAALEAVRNWGAKYGIGEGFWGRSYGIPTKDRLLRVLDLSQVTRGIENFKSFAIGHPDEFTFLVTRIGCGLAGYQDEQIAPLFRGSPDNCEFDPLWTLWGLNPWVRSPNEISGARG